MNDSMKSFQFLVDLWSLKCLGKILQDFLPKKKRVSGCTTCTRCKENPWRFFWCSDGSGWCFLDNRSALASKFKVVSVDLSLIHVLKTSFDDNASCISTTCLLTVLVSVCWATFVPEYYLEYHPPYWKSWVSRKEGAKRLVVIPWSLQVSLCWIHFVTIPSTFVESKRSTKTQIILITCLKPPQVSEFVYGYPWIEMSPTIWSESPREILRFKNYKFGPHEEGTKSAAGGWVFVGQVGCAGKVGNCIGKNAN